MLNWLSIKVKSTIRQRCVLLVLLAALVFIIIMSAYLFWSPNKFKQFLFQYWQANTSASKPKVLDNSPAETAPCAFDKEPYHGVSFDGFNLGISLHRFIQQVKQRHMLDRIDRGNLQSVNDGVRQYFLGPLPMGNISWEPTFFFVREMNVFRLYMIYGSVESKNFPDVNALLTNQWGPPINTPNGNGLVWQDHWTADRYTTDTDFTTHIDLMKPDVTVGGTIRHWPFVIVAYVYDRLERFAVKYQIPDSGSFWD